MKNQSSTKILTLALAAICWLTQQAWAQAPVQSPAPHPPATANSVETGASVPAQSQPDTQAPSATQKPAAAEPSPNALATANNTAVGTTDSAPPQPVTTYPDASGAEQRTQPAESGSLPSAPQPKSQPAEPQGAAAAEKVSTAGGAAAKPAGVAIAPAKQHRTRSILIKVGALAAAGVAAGTVYALSRGTPSVPPGSNSPIAVPK